MGTVVIIGIAVISITTMLLSIQFPAIDNTIVSVCNLLLEYIQQAMGIVWLFLPKTITMTILGAVLAIELVIMGYHFVMWVLRKIPAAGIN